MARRTPPLSPNLPMVDPDSGRPTPFFLRWWQDQIDTNKEIVSLSTAAEVSAVVDLLGDQHGSVLYRSSTAWTALTAGTSGQVLTTQGPGANPVWADIAGTFLDLSDTPASFSGQAGKTLQVNVGETALEFTDATGGADFEEVELIQGAQGKSSTLFGSWNITVSTDPSTNDDVWIIGIVGQTDNPPTGMTFDGVTAAATHIRALGSFDHLVVGVFKGITGTGVKTVTVTGSLGTEYRATLIAYQLRNVDVPSIRFDSNTSNTAPASLTITPQRSGGFAFCAYSVDDTAAATEGGTLASSTRVITEGVVETNFRSSGFRQDPADITGDTAVTFTFEESVGSDDRNIGFMVLAEPKLRGNLSSIADVDLDYTPTNGDVLTYNSTTGLWENAAAAGGVSDFLSLTDTPSAYTGFDDGDYFVSVNDAATALSFGWIYRAAGYQLFPSYGDGIGLPFSTTYSGSAFAAKGDAVTCVESCIIKQVIANINDTNSYKLVVAEMSDATSSFTITRILFDGPNVTAAGGGSDTIFNTADTAQSGPLLEAGKTYSILVVRTDAGNTGVNAIEFPAGSSSFSGTELTALYSLRYAEDDPVIGDNPYNNLITNSYVRMQIDLWKGNAARTISDQADVEISDTQGSILYRDADRWVALPPGTADHVLKTKGAGANPAWEAESGGGGGGSSAAFRGFRATVSGTQAISAGVTTVMNFGTEVYDTENGFASNVFTVPAAYDGEVMQFTAGVRFATVGNSNLYIQKDTAGDGVFISIAQENHDSSASMTTSAEVEVATGDVVRVVLFCSAAETVQNDVRNSFTGHVIGGVSSIESQSEAVNYAATGQTEVDIALPTDGKSYRIVGWIEAATDAVNILGEVTNDNFATTETGANYDWNDTRWELSTATGNAKTGLAGDTSMRLVTNAGNAANERVWIDMTVVGNSDASGYTAFMCHTNRINSAGLGYAGESMAQYRVAEAINGLRLEASAGNIDYDLDVIPLGAVQNVTESFVVAASDETTALTTGTGKATFRMPYAFTVTEVRASVTTAPTGSTVLTVDINENGVSILSTPITIDASEKTSTTAATPAVISDSALADDAEITIDIDAVGSSVAGAGLKVTIIGYKA